MEIYMMMLRHVATDALGAAASVAIRIAAKRASELISNVYIVVESLGCYTVK